MERVFDLETTTRVLKEQSAGTEIGMCTDASFAAAGERLAGRGWVVQQAGRDHRIRTWAIEEHVFAGSLP